MRTFLNEHIFQREEVHKHKKALSFIKKPIDSKDKIPKGMEKQLKNNC